MFPDVQPTSELACSQAESLEIFAALIDKMNPFVSRTCTTPNCSSGKYPIMRETEAGDSLGNENAAAAKQRSGAPSNPPSYAD
jgi:hypothetical protein